MRGCGGISILYSDCTEDFRMSGWRFGALGRLRVGEGASERVWRRVLASGGALGGGVGTCMVDGCDITLARKVSTRVSSESARGVAGPPFTCSAGTTGRSSSASSASPSLRNGVAAPLSLETHSSSSVVSERTIEKSALRSVEGRFADRGAIARRCCRPWSFSFDWTRLVALKCPALGYGDVVRWLWSCPMQFHSSETQENRKRHDEHQLS